MRAWTFCLTAVYCTSQNILNLMFKQLWEHVSSIIITCWMFGDISASSEAHFLTKRKPDLTDLCKDQSEKYGDWRKEWCYVLKSSVENHFISSSEKNGFQNYSTFSLILRMAAAHNVPYDITCCHACSSELLWTVHHLTQTKLLFLMK